jgi:hypothetical protein
MMADLVTKLIYETWDTVFDSSDAVIDTFLYSKNPEMFTTFGYRTCHKVIYEGSM